MIEKSSAVSSARKPSANFCAAFLACAALRDCGSLIVDCGVWRGIDRISFAGYESFINSTEQQFFCFALHSLSAVHSHAIVAHVWCRCWRTLNVVTAQ